MTIALLGRGLDAIVQQDHARMRASLVVEHARRETQTGLERLAQCGVVTEVRILELRKVPGSDEVHKGQAALGLPSLDVNVVPVVAGIQRVPLDLWRHDALPVDGMILTGERAVVNGVTA
ncbi:hypothetical protein [Xanthomonas sp. MWU16-30325]|uniref:hypothetical protein n=1 Tax=Xanthomonas sp. MWU16-30325 TaxID=2878096 RepID=UPI001CF7FFE3|nr:hypothetical protein [Xanthomonas sp. MWU16-30325]